jgi:putative protease
MKESISKNSVLKPELLLPAGDMEKLKAAFTFGADAVYLAGEYFGLRAEQTSFSKEEMKEAMAYAHSLGKKAYVTVNSLAHEDDLKGLDAYIAFLESIAVDAVIVSDPGILSRFRTLAPEIEIHISTQASTCNSASCKFWYDQGVKRIVLARELSLSEIRQIRANIPPDMELECFVHGAMCMAYSGRCLLSNVLTGRDANRGRCAQPCRWEWTLQTRGERDEIHVEEDSEGAYFFNSRDLCLIDHIPELLDAGINSLKVEGRMKGAFYVATVAKNYRAALDSYLEDPEAYQMNPLWREELDQMVHRTYDTGFYFDKPQEDPKVDLERSYHKEATVCGRVLEDGPERIYCSQRNKLYVGDEVEIIRPQGPNLKLRISRLQDEEGEAIETTPHPKMGFFLFRGDLSPDDRSEPIPAGSFIRREGDKDTPRA